MRQGSQTFTRGFNTSLVTQYFDLLENTHLLDKKHKTYQYCFYMHFYNFNGHPICLRVSEVFFVL